VESIRRFRNSGWLRFRLKLDVNEGLKVEKIEFVAWRLLLKSTSNEPPVGMAAKAPTL